MAPRYMNDRVKLLLTLTVFLKVVISSTQQDASKKTEKDDYVIRNIGIKLCNLKCAEHGQCVSIEYDIVTLTCRLSRDPSNIEKKEGPVIAARSHSHVTTGSCTSGVCSFDQRCLKTRSGKDVCVQASTTDNRENKTPIKTVPSAPVTTQDSDPHATPSQTTHFFSASSRGDLERLKRILATGHVNINSRGEFSRTPVMVAARMGHRDVVKFLVGRGAEVSMVDEEGYNVLHWACWGGDLKTVKFILSLNILHVNATSKYGKTANDNARLRRHQRVVDLLVSRGAY